MKLKIFFISFVIFLVYCGCEKTELGRELNCTIGTTYRVTHDLYFTIDSLNDSRCPPYAECIWAGDVYIYLNIHHSKTQIDTTMYLRDTSRNPIQIGGYSFKVLEVNPDNGGGLTTSKDFTIRMVVTKN
jgi:hypothetical protein